MTERIRILLETLALEDTGARTSEDIFTGASHPMPFGRVFGGQVMAQAVVAAQRTVDDAHTRYFIAHLHRLTDEGAAASPTEELRA